MIKLIAMLFSLFFMTVLQRNAYAQSLASLVQTPLSDQAIVESHIIKMPDNYNSESKDVNFCYAFTAANLINQMIFNSTTKNQNYEPISMLDIAVYGSGFGTTDLFLGSSNTIPLFDDFGNTYRTLIYSKFAKKTAVESCAPFNRLKILQSTNSNRSQDFISLGTVLKPAFDAKSEGKDIDYNSIANEVLAWEPNLKSPKNQIIDVLKNNQMDTYQDFLKILGGIVVPNSCKENATILPDFEVSLAKIDETNHAQTSEYFISTLNRERPLGWEFCIDDSCETQHALVVFGWRKLCTQNKQICNLQFLLRDSGTQTNNQPGDFWVDIATIESKIKLMLNKYEALDKAGILPNKIINLEYK